MRTNHTLRTEDLRVLEELRADLVTQQHATDAPATVSLNEPQRRGDNGHRRSQPKGHEASLRGTMDQPMSRVPSKLEEFKETAQRIAANLQRADGEHLAQRELPTLRILCNELPSNRGDWGKHIYRNLKSAAGARGGTRSSQLRKALDAIVPAPAPPSRQGRVPDSPPTREEYSCRYCGGWIAVEDALPVGSRMACRACVYSVKCPTCDRRRRDGWDTCGSCAGVRTGSVGARPHPFHM